MIKLLYFCSFVPYLTLQNMGFDIVSGYDACMETNGNSRLSGNLCSFIKYCEKIDFTQYDGIIFTNCCNSTQRLYDYVKYHYPKLYMFLLEVPRNKNERINYYSMFSSLEKQFNLSENTENKEEKTAPVPGIVLHQLKIQRDGILIIASSLHKEYVGNLTKIFSGYNLKLESCQSVPRGDFVLNKTMEISCPRMMGFFKYIRNKIDQVSAVIYIITQRCDYIMFTYPQIKKICEDRNMKCLVLEEEYVGHISERGKIRYEAFKESLELDKIRI